MVSGDREIIGISIFFFFQAEDGIRYLTVTGVQTCALPISGLWLASHSPAPRMIAPVSTTTRVPRRSLAAPQANPANPMTRKSSVMALEMAARLQPVAAEIGPRNTASENIAPMATQPISPPSPTITQR